MSPKPKNTPHRVLLSLPTDLYNTISRVSAAMDKPRAEIIRDLLAEQQPILEHMATMLEQAKGGDIGGAFDGLTGEGWQIRSGHEGLAENDRGGIERPGRAHVSPRYKKGEAQGLRRCKSSIQSFLNERG